MGASVRGYGIFEVYAEIYHEPGAGVKALLSTIDSSEWNLFIVAFLSALENVCQHRSLNESVSEKDRVNAKKYRSFYTVFAKLQDTGIGSTAEIIG